MKKVIAGVGLVAAVMLGGNTGWANVHTEVSWSGDSLASGAQLLVMNGDQFEGNWRQFKGAVKQRWGKLTDDDLMQIEGNYDRYQGKLQERYGDQREEVQRWTDEWFKTHQPTP